MQQEHCCLILSFVVKNVAWETNALLHFLHHYISWFPNEWQVYSKLFWAGLTAVKKFNWTFVEYFWSVAPLCLYKHSHSPYTSVKNPAWNDYAVKGKGIRNSTRVWIPSSLMLLLIVPYGPSECSHDAKSWTWESFRKVTETAQM